MGWPPTATTGKTSPLARKIVSGEVNDGWKVVEPGAGEHYCRRDNIL